MALFQIVCDDTNVKAFNLPFIQNTTEKTRKIVLHNTRIDYECRPVDLILENTCLYDFVANYEITKKPPINKPNNEDIQETYVTENYDEKGNIKKTHAKPILERYKLHISHPLEATHVLNSRSHKIPVLIGPQIP